MNKEINYVANIRRKIKQDGYNAMLVNSKDIFLSEFAINQFNYLQKITGFQGSNGYLLITLNSLYFFTDGRYIEEAKSLGKKYKIYNLSDLDNLKISEKLKLVFPAFNFKISEIDFFKKKLLKKNEIYAKDFDYFRDLFDVDVEFKSKYFLLPKNASSKTREDKISNLRDQLNLKNNDIYIVNDSNNLSWLLNIRANDVEYNLVLCGFLFIQKNKMILFADCDDVDLLKKELKIKDLIIKSKSEIISELEKLNSKIKNVFFDKNETSYFFKNYFKAKNIINIEDPILLAKSIKNNVEIKNIKAAHINDGVALTKFLYWLDQFKAKSVLSEIDLIMKLEEFRQLNNKYLMPSFATICGFEKNGAIIHYKADENSNLYLNKNSLLLIDSGGHYKYGTTDITRTIAIGKPTQTMINHFTLVLKGHIALALIKFPKNNFGYNLDILARQFLWEKNLDYQHGTGHGVGYCLNVHEGPCNIAKNLQNHPIKESMIFSNEPGYYVKNQYGIRIENLLLTTKYKENFLQFETISFAPIDNKLINKNLLTNNEINWYNKYHNKIIQNLGDKITNRELNWLKKFQL